MFSPFTGELEGVFYDNNEVKKMSEKRINILLDTTAFVLALPTSKLPPSTK